MLDRSHLNGKVAIVTGAASGIGLATARMLSNKGCDVYGLDVSCDASAGDTPVRRMVRVNIADAQAVRAFFTELESSRFGIDYVVNCAGVSPVATIQETTDEMWDTVFAVNVGGVKNVVKGALPLMKAGGAIVNVSSAAGIRAIPNLTAYVSSKAAVIGLTQALAVDLAPFGIRCNCICPGLVDTPLARSTQDDRPEELQGSTANFDLYLIKRFGVVQELADAIVFMLTNEYITGATLAVDGGRSLH